MIAWHNDPSLKATTIAEMEDHRAADRLVQQRGYWSGGRGCAVGCLLKSGNHSEYEPRFGIPRTLAWLEDCIFEGLPHRVAMDWPVRFLTAIRPGTDLSLVGWKFFYWLVAEEIGERTGLSERAKAACIGVANAIKPKTRGEKCDPVRLIEARNAAATYAAAAATYAAAAAAAAAADARKQCYLRMADKLVELIEAV